VTEELKKFIGKELFVDLVGKTFAPKGVLIKVENDFILIDENRIFLNNVASFRPADNRHNNSSAVRKW